LSDKECADLLFPEVLVKKIEIKEITPCTADPERINFLAQADKPLEDVLPILYLAILKNCGLVNVRKVGNRRFYSVTDQDIFRVIDAVNAELVDALSKRVIEQIV